MKKKGLGRFFTLDVHNHEGFTLVELIVVIAILAILGGVAVPVYGGYVSKANQAADDTLISEINLAFRSACIENMHDVYDIQDARAAISGGEVTVSNVKVNDAINTEIASDFDTYFDETDVELKYYPGVVFSSSLHQFVPSGTNITGEVLQGIWAAFDGISGEYFATAITEGWTLEQLKDFAMEGISDDIAKMLGLEDMVEGFSAAINISDDDLEGYLEQYVEGYAEMDADQRLLWKNSNTDTITTLRGNLGIMYFANDVKDNNRTQEEVMANLDKIMYAAGQTTDLSNQELVDYYSSSLRGDAKTDFDNLTFDQQWEIVEKDMGKPISHVGFTYQQLASLEKALGDAENTTGISTMGAMYAMAAGFYNSSLYESDPYENFTPMYGIFEDVAKAMLHPKFQDYYMDQNAGASADIKEYLEQMNALAADTTVDLTSPDAFSNRDN